MKILFVSRDNGGAKLSVPTILEFLRYLRKTDYEISVVVEGLAADRFQDADFFASYSSVKLLFRGLENASLTPFSVDADSVLKKFMPDVVVITRSIPDSLESQFGVAANKARIPVVLMEDYWAGHRTSLARPDVLVTLDEYAEKLAVQHYGSGTRVVVAGNPTVIEPHKIDIPREVRDRVDELRTRFKRVFVFAGAGIEQTTAELKLLRKCLKRTNDWCLVVRPHPTLAKSEKEPGLSWGSYWNDMFKEFGERIVSVESRMGDPLAVLADATISGTSLMLNTAAYARRAAISPQTEIAKKELLSIGLTEVPIVGLGCGRALYEPCDLDAGGFLEPTPKNCLARLKSFDPSVAVEAIESLVRSRV